MIIFSNHKNFYKLQTEKRICIFDINTGKVYGKSGKEINTLPKIPTYDSYDLTTEESIAYNIFLAKRMDFPLEEIQALERGMKILASNHPQIKICFKELWSVKNRVKFIPPEYFEKYCKSIKFNKDTIKTKVLKLNCLIESAFIFYIVREKNISEQVASYIKRQCGTFHKTILFFEDLKPLELQRLEAWITKDHADIYIYRLIDIIKKSKEMGWELPKTHNLTRWAYEDKKITNFFNKSK